MGDQVVGRDEATVWLAPTAAEALDNTVLDEGGDDEGHIQVRAGSAGLTYDNVESLGHRVTSGLHATSGGAEGSG
jgi:hypothetical protein